MISKVSVAILTYNSIDFIEETIESVISQTYDNWEIIVGDDASTDGTQEVLKRYKGLLKDKMKLILHEENMGANRNWNSIVPLLTGKYIAKLDGDDYWGPTKLEDQLEYMESNNDIVISYHPVFKVNQKQNKIEYMKVPVYLGSASQILIKNGCFMCSPSVMWKNCNNNYVHQDLRYVGDWYLWIMIGSKGNIGYIDKPLSYYRIHGDNVTVKGNKIKYIEDNIKILELVEKELNIDSSTIEKSIGKQLLYITTTYIKSRNIPAARDYIMRIPFSNIDSKKGKFIKLIFVLRVEFIFKMYTGLSGKYE